MKNRLQQAGMQLEEVRDLDDLERVPVMKKPELIAAQRQHLPFGGLCGLNPEELHRIYISPGPIYEPGEAVGHDYRWAQALYAHGFRRGDIAQVTFNFNMVPVGFWLDEALRQLGCICVPAGVGNTELQLQIMRELRVTAYLGTPSFLATIADRAEEIGLDLKRDLQLEVAFVAAEVLTESLRGNLEERFGMMVRQSYGTADVGCLGFECGAKAGMHLPDDAIVEIVDPKSGRPGCPNEPGEVVATVFDRAYPLIRFGTGDLSLVTEDPCACGRTSPRLVRILGRVDQAAKVKGLFIHPNQVDDVSKRIAELGNCQVVVTRQANQDRMVFRAEVVTSGFDPGELADRVGRMVQEIFRLKSEVDLLPPSSIAVGAKKIDDQRKWD
ncbi:MAG TPA: phenylacetate--CoA ligase [Syntrophobacteraceae bacterium]|nr:phenylacetate--CoA ligase [Syntrophobacteraceae bacterium]